MRCTAKITGARLNYAVKIITWPQRMPELRWGGWGEMGKDDTRFPGKPRKPHIRTNVPGPRNIRTDTYLQS